MDLKFMQSAGNVEGRKFIH